MDVYKVKYLKQVFKNEINSSIPFSQITKKSFKNFPFILMEIDDLKCLDNILARSVTIQYFIHLISFGKNYEELF